MRGYTDSSYGDAFADVYDDWYAGLDDVAATVGALAELARRGGGGRVLELGVGTGRIAIPLAAAGLEVHGVDASQAMLERLAGKPGGDAVIGHLGDMATALPAGDFSLIFVAYNTFWNLLTEERQKTCITEVARRLGADGSFVVEAFVPDPAMHDPRSPKQPQVSVRSLAVDRVVLSVTAATADEQRVDGHFVDISEAEGVRLRPWSIRWVTVDQLDEMASAAGLALRDRWESFDGSPFRDATQANPSTRHVSVYSR